jgi:hypothetical protein
MILQSNTWQDHNGASHRKNLDTPSLAGSCWSALRRLRRDTKNKGLTTAKALQSALRRSTALCFFEE